ncbi:MAG: branched-chain amino acid ABC transporter permease [Variibacter sp.]
MDIFLQQIMNGAVIGSTYAVVAVGFALVFIVLRVVNFAHPEIFMLGMFSGLWAALHISDNLAVVLVAGAIGAGLGGLVLERAVIRPLHGRNMLMTLLATLGVSIILQNGMAIITGPDPVPYPTIIPNMSVPLGPVSLTARQLVNFAACIILLITASYYVRGTKYGRATRAVAERPDVAAAFGVNVSLISLITVVFASLMAGIAAVSVGLLYGSAWAFVGLLYGLKAFIILLVAGNRYFEGVVFVAIALGIIEALITGYVSSGMRDVVTFTLLIGVLYFRPNGVFGSYNA